MCSSKSQTKSVSVTLQDRPLSHLKDTDGVLKTY